MTTNNRKVLPIRPAAKRVGAGPKYADIQWNEKRTLFWLRLHVAISASVMPQRNTEGLFTMRTSWLESQQEGTRGEMERAAVEALTDYMKMMEVL
jgi:hypothetical protein